MKKKDLAKRNTSKVGKEIDHTKDFNFSNNSLVSAGYSEFPFGITASGNQWFDRLSLLIMKDCLNPDKKIMTLDQWCLSVGIYPQDLDSYREQNETFDKAVRVAKTAIAERRERLLEQSPQALAFIQPQFSDRWEKEYDRRQKVKANLESKGKVVVEVHPVPSTDIVKEREIESIEE